MTHTGGFEEEIRDILLTDPKKASSLRDFLVANQPRRIFPPGEVAAYLHYGVGLGGYTVQRGNGGPCVRFVAGHIFFPGALWQSSVRHTVPCVLSPLVPSVHQRNTV